VYLVSSYVYPMCNNMYSTNDEYYVSMLIHWFVSLPVACVMLNHMRPKVVENFLSLSRTVKA